MFKILKDLLMGIGPALAAKIMAALGFAVFSYSAYTEILNNFIDSAKYSVDHVSIVNSFAFAILNIAGFQQALAILYASMSARFGLFALKKIQLK